MNILVIGSHGKVGKRLIRVLAEKGHTVRAMIRKKEQMAEMTNRGAEAFLADLEEDFSKAYQGMEIVIFTAGSGGHTGPDKTIDIDQNAAIKAVELALQYHSKRFIMVSAQGARIPEEPSKIQHYYKAKSKADNFLIKSGQIYTIFRPGRLSDEKGSGKIQSAAVIIQRGQTSRDNLALAIAESLNLRNLENKVIDILDGTEPINSALKVI